MASVRRIVDHPSTRVVLLILAGAQAMIGAFVLGLAVNIGTSSVSPRGNAPATVTDVPADRGPFPLVAVSVAGIGGTPQSITVTADGELWFTVNQPPAIGRIEAGGRVTRYPTRSQQEPGMITLRRDGGVWYTDPAAGAIGFVTSSGAMVRYPIGAAGFPRGIVAGPDGNVWFTFDAFDGDWIGRMTPTGGVTRFPLPANSRDPGAIIAGPDDNLWFAVAGSLGRITTGGEITEVPVSATAGGLATGPDATIWFTGNSATGAATVGRVETGRAPKVTGLYDLPEGAVGRGIVAGSDGNMWLANQARESITRVSPRGQITRYTLGGGQYPEAMAASTDGRLWFTFLSPRGTGGVATFTVPR